MDDAHHDTCLNMTRRVIATAFPEEAGLVEAPGFPDVDAGKVPRGPLGIGFEPGLILVAPLVYMFFESLLRESGKSAAEGLSNILARRGERSEITEDDAIAFFAARGLDKATAQRVVAYVLDEIDGRAKPEEES